ncbi:winged helix-turn-helix transcriptional regulator [Streptomyces sp. NPDC048751]|uniref:winged helix-turn-helix transcriptional regulator n=1 Tax=Streptomyces sp. NPDC048751 TaxID=3365591 RepID=UPI003716583F
MPGAVRHPAQPLAAGRPRGHERPSAPHGSSSTRELHRAVPGISGRILSDRLTHLAAEGLVLR